MTNSTATARVGLRIGARVLCACALVAVSSLPAAAQQRDSTGKTRPIHGLVVKSKTSPALKTSPAMRRTVRDAVQTGGDARIRTAPMRATRGPAVPKPTVQKQPKAQGSTN